MLHTIFFRAFSATFIFLSTLGAAIADDLALVIGNRNYRNAARMSGAENALTSGRALRNSGFTVVSGRDLDGRQTRQALMDFVDRLDGSDSLVVMLSGHFVHTDGDTWFLPVDSPKPTLASVNFDGVSLNTLFEIVGQKPGGAAVFLGTFPRPINLGAGLTAGIGDLNLPQGVFAATGRPDDIDQTLRRNFLPDGTGLADALADAPGSVTGHGFISNITSIQGPVGGRAASDELEVLEAGYWMAMLDLDTQEAMEAYQRRYPSGNHAQEARDWIADHRPLTEAEQAKEDEADLNLTREL